VTDDLRALLDQLDEDGAELVGWIACCWVERAGQAQLLVVASESARKDAQANLASAQLALAQANGAMGAVH
jgi:hypothetical protein